MSLRISVVIPTLNEASHIGACLDALAQQTVPPNEVIVVDNGSVDDTVQIARLYPFVRILHESRRGIVFARNTGFDAARGDVIARIDADTISPTDWIEKLLTFAGTQPQDFACTGPSSFRNSFGWIMTCTHWLIYFVLGRNLLGHTVLFGSNMAISRSLWSRVRPSICRTSRALHEDMDIGVHIHRLGVPIFFVPGMRNTVLARPTIKKLLCYPIMFFRIAFTHR